jgi:hypothetical protein
MIALAIRDIVTELGDVVPAVASRPNQAFSAIEGQSYDCAILEVNVAGTLPYKIAIALCRRNIAAPAHARTSSRASHSPAA